MKADIHIYICLYCYDGQIKGDDSAEFLDLGNILK